ncbi:Sec-independent protein translocase protein TatB [Endozoicomonas sp. 8E]|uniref:Sec-independent protein translocase protein TatB n=1 Tax=Endozoicomonas sp. 8E TaxID=3035692 RepID=UPI002938E727|nr:Sec-independent protein translocase protein TatB [Endozoicomonas sp. 8E]WOG29279.1 Sec-independent protein translocase protein TatB [Endozoicomonas sp. 8E]
MFDIGFTELLLIAVIALVVLGPERLPGAIRTTAYWIGKIKRSFQSAREELEKELDVDGIKRQIHNEQVMKELEKTRSQVTESIKEPLEALNKPIDPDTDRGERDSGGSKSRAQNETEEKKDKSA